MEGPSSPSKWRIRTESSVNSQSSINSHKFIKMSCLALASGRKRIKSNKASTMLDLSCKEPSSRNKSVRNATNFLCFEGNFKAKFSMASIMTDLKSSVISSIRVVIFVIKRSTLSPPATKPDSSTVPAPIVFNKVVMASVEIERLESFIKFSNSKLTTTIFSGCLTDILLIKRIAENLVAVRGTPRSFCKVDTTFINWSSLIKC